MEIACYLINATKTSHIIDSGYYYGLHWRIFLYWYFCPLPIQFPWMNTSVLLSMVCIVHIKGIITGMGL